MRRDVRFGSKADIGEGAVNVRFTPESGHWLSASGCLLCAKSGHWLDYSITSSAVASKVAGIGTSIALAVLRLG
jgi:hypothetical protein